MLWPLMLADRKGASVKNRFPLYLGTQVTLPAEWLLGIVGWFINERAPMKLRCVQFLTNVFFIPYMALREFRKGGRPNDAEPGVEPSALPSYARLIGRVGAAVGLVTLLYVPLARPEYGGLADRCAAWVHASACTAPCTA